MSFVGSLDQITDADRAKVDAAKPITGIPPALNAVVRELERALMINQLRYTELEAYYQGKHPHSFDSIRFQQAFGKQLRTFADNWMRLVVKATADRLVVQGFRVGDGDDTDAADNEAWRVWQASRLDAGAPIAHRDAMKFGTSFLLVDPFDSAGNRLPRARITVESPMQVVGQRDAQDRFLLVKAIKKWVGNDDHLYLNLYLPEVVYKLRSAAPAQTALPNDVSRITQQVAWELVGDVENPIGVVPIVPMENCPDLLMGGHSDLDDLIPLNDGLNKVLRDMLVTSEYQAFQQRVIIGAEIPKDPVSGKPMTENQIQLMASRSRAWLFPNPQTKVESLAQVDLAPYTNAVDLFIHHISMISQTPAYMLVGKMANLPLAIDTVVPTPSGRSTMGDLKVGDTVYAPDGSEQKVVAVSPVKHGRPCYRMVFDDGTEIVADGEHKWATTHFANPANPYQRRRGTQRETSVVTTEEIARSLRTSMGTYNHFIPVAQSHQGPTLQYPVDPYALGVWLGDGSRGLAQVTAHVRDAFEMADHLRQTGETVTVREYPAHDEIHRDTRILSLTSDKEKCPRGHSRPRGTKHNTARCTTCTHLHFRRRYYGEPLPEPTNVAFRRRLEDLGVLKNKHIPEEYFHGSIEQRLALLQGIMDTDGTVYREQGPVAITLHDERLATDVQRLAQSLGHKVKLRRRQWRSHGRGLVSARTGECWRMSWTPHHIVFRLERKARLQRLPVEGGDGRSSSPFRRYIVSCDPVESVPVRCINVSHPTHLFCVTDAFVATHNSADAIRAAELGFVGKLQTKQTDFGEAWEQAITLALAADRGDEVISTIWKDAAANSGSILSNELVQMASLGVPQEVLFERWGASPQDIRRWRAKPPVPPEQLQAGNATTRSPMSQPNSDQLSSGAPPAGQAPDG